MFFYYSFEIRKKDKRAIILSLNNSFFQRILHSLNESVLDEDYNETSTNIVQEIFNYLNSLEGILVCFNSEKKIFFGKNEARQTLESVIAGEEIKTKRFLYLVEERNMKAAIMSLSALSIEDKTLVKLCTLLINILSQKTSLKIV